jgi:hypothetical protein
MVIASERGIGRGRHHEQMWGGPFQQHLVPLLYPEAMLFIDHSQTQVVKRHLLLKNGVGAHGTWQLPPARSLRISRRRAVFCPR